ncbi:hypothetical protein XELAEV_18044496mg [Xenopus laevis]|uniref:Non-homologous end-joining factor 1 n=1 Tax=Xenopus laevis TaxID=8355 RepID=A0A974BYT9_XENLA|nr:hypothetical protein XELAEV_18044496mg [Xenopus laevis]
MDAQLLQLLWRSLRIADCTFLGKVCFTESSYALLLSDLSGMWCEEAEANIIQERVRELNKRLKAPVSSFLSYLSQIVFPLLNSRDNGQNVFSCHRSETQLLLQVNSQLSGLPFYLNFHCKEATISMRRTVDRSGFILTRLIPPEPIAHRNRIVRPYGRTIRLPPMLPNERIFESMATFRGHLKTEVFDELKFQKAFLVESRSVSHLTPAAAANFPLFSCWCLCWEGEYSSLYQFYGWHTAAKCGMRAPSGVQGHVPWCHCTPGSSATGSTFLSLRRTSHLQIKQRSILP